ncbi:hypothetical protein KB206_01770 [Microvirga sp. STS02]|uniref:hypothetical protein n=1 Tax=Hymenobacter negativus TaxID=2795026 RepID=UPI0018DC1FA0|nr:MULTISPECIES: hypothetical protein [Bacteria]MBH8567594.1 hypothetical protein [Hymenobacter negativus]MBR7207326.1 hypothetical protein [Microvirga sp. STS02]
MNSDLPDTSIWRYPSVTELLYSPLLPAQILERLQQSIKPDLVWGIFHREPFSGSIEGNSFVICWQSHRSKEAPPEMHGLVQAAPQETGSILTVQYKERTIALVGYGVFGVVMVTIRLIDIAKDIQQQQFSWLSLFLPLLALIPLSVLLFASFRYRVWRSRRALAELLLLKKLSAV